jgi:cell division protein FtsB
MNDILINSAEVIEYIVTNRAQAATIEAQAAEIERLTAENDAMRRQITKQRNMAGQLAAYGNDIYKVGR